MGLLDDVVGTAVRRTEDTLTYRAGDAVSSTAIKGAGKLLGKGKDDAAKPLDRCPKCKAKVDPDAKFCPKCGQPLVVTCAGCKVDYPLGTKFCKQCGAKLA